MTMSDRKLAYRLQGELNASQALVGKLAVRVGVLEGAIAAHRRGVLEDECWDDEALWRVLPRAIKVGRKAA